MPALLSQPLLSNLLVAPVYYGVFSPVWISGGLIGGFANLNSFPRTVLKPFFRFVIFIFVVALFAAEKTTIKIHRLFVVLLFPRRIWLFQIDFAISSFFEKLHTGCDSSTIINGLFSSLCVV